MIEPVNESQTLVEILLGSDDLRSNVFVVRAEVGVERHGALGREVRGREYEGSNESANVESLLSSSSLYEQTNAAQVTMDWRFWICACICMYKERSIELVNRRGCE